MEAGRNKTVAGKTAAAWRHSRKEVIFYSIIIALFVLGVTMFIYSLSERNRNDPAEGGGQLLDGMTVFFNRDRTAVDRISVHGKEVKPGLSLKDLKMILGDPQDVTELNKTIPNVAAANKDAARGEVVATYYIGHNYYLFYFDAASPPRIKLIHVDGGY